MIIANLSKELNEDLSNIAGKPSLEALIDLFKGLSIQIDKLEISTDKSLCYPKQKILLNTGDSYFVEAKIGFNGNLKGIELFLTKQI